MGEEVGNLPGTGDTMIKKVVPSGGDQCIAPRLVETCDLPKRGRLGCAIFDSGGLRSRNPLLSFTIVNVVDAREWEIRYMFILELSCDYNYLLENITMIALLGVET